MSLKNYCILFLLYALSFSSYSQNTKSDYNFVSLKEGLPKVGIYSITQDNYGFTWIGTNGSGLYKFDGSDYTSYKYKYKDSTSISCNLIFSSYLSKSNELWIGTEDGLNLYNRDLDKFKKIKIPLNGAKEAQISVLSINEDNDNNLIDLNDINLRLSENVEF